MQMQQLLLREMQVHEEVYSKVTGALETSGPWMFEDEKNSQNKSAL